MLFQTGLTVVQHRMQAEYGVETILEPLAGYNAARWAEGGWDAIDEAQVQCHDEFRGTPDSLDILIGYRKSHVLNDGFYIRLV